METITATIGENVEHWGELYARYRAKRLQGVRVVYEVADSSLTEVARAQVYGNPGGSTYALVWVNYGACEGRVGAGSARGYGYHKPSAAIAGALKDAGFELNVNIAAAGDRAIDDALLAVAKAVGATGNLVVKSFE
ncbi:MAG: hypothetical protein BWY01_01495 [Synergistetes bacterium ADurb.Bin155]|nr:MAG: hypothetical protein BWY01_01495 [Synergistetes bacterium ADurb.Bin155]